MEESAAHQIAGNETLVCQLKEDILQLKQVNHRLMEDAEQSNELLLKGCTLTSMESSVEKDLSNGFRLKSLSASTTVSSFKSSSNISNNHLIIGQLPDMNQNGSSGATLVGAEDEEDEDDVVDLSQISQIKSLQSENSELKEQIEALSDYIKKMVDKISGNEQLELAFMGGVNEKEEKERRNITNISFNNSLNASRKQAEIKSLHSVPAIDMISVDHHSGSAITTEDEEDEEVNEEEQAVNDDDLSAPVFRYKGYMIKM